MSHPTTLLYNKIIPILLVLSTCILAACGASQPAKSVTNETAIQSAVSTSVAATQKVIQPTRPAPSPTAIPVKTLVDPCPIQTADNKLLTDTQNGFCFLYPSNFSLKQPAPNVFTVLGPPLDQGLEPLQALLTVKNEGAANGRDIQALASQFWGASRTPVTTGTITLGGENALAADNVVTGEMDVKAREVLVLHDGTVYHLIFSPVDSDPTFAKAAPDIALLWNAVMPSFAFVSSGTAHQADLAQFETTLVKAVTERNFDIMAPLMGNPFDFSGWQTESNMVAPDRAVETMRSTSLAAPTPVSCEKAQPDQLGLLLGGADPYTMGGAGVKVTSIFLCQGWGKDGKAQALLMVAQRIDNKYYWYGVLVADHGFQPVSAEGANPLGAFESRLTPALTKRNFDYMKKLMGNRFSINIWKAEGKEYSADDAIQMLQTEFLASSTPVTLERPSREGLKDMLGGTDAYTSLGPAIPVVMVYYSQGWGKDGKGQALLYVSLHPDRSYYWHNVLFAPQGFK